MYNYYPIGREEPNGSRDEVGGREVGGSTETRRLQDCSTSSHEIRLAVPDLRQS